MPKPTRDPLHGIQERINRVFEDILQLSPAETRFGSEAWKPPMDVFETGAEVVVTLEITGLSRDAIELSLEDDTLVIQGERTAPSGSFHRMERSHGVFQRQVPLPAAVDPDQVKARYNDGVLTVRLAKLGGTGTSIHVEVSE